MKNNRIRRILMVAAGIYLAYTGFDAYESGSVGSSERINGSFWRLRALSCVWSDGYCYECQRHDTGLRKMAGERKNQKTERRILIANRDGI